VNIDPATSPAGLRHRAETHASAFPALLAQADHLAASVVLGEHGRRRAGMGDEFWQYRPAELGDGLRDIDWRRSAKSDAHFVRQKEWQAAQSVMLWVDDALSMTFTGGDDRPTKGHRARVIATALCVLLNRGGERFGLANRGTPPRRGEAHIGRIATHLMAPSGDADYGTPNARVLPPGSRGVFISDFLGEPEAVEKALTQAADRGVKGALLQILDTDEEAFPFDGRTIFETMSGAVQFETLKAKSLRDAYLDRLAERKTRLQDVAKKTGWRFMCHHTSDPATKALLWLYQSLDHRAV
jgi:MoxR-like ATPase